MINWLRRWRRPAISRGIRYTKDVLKQYDIGDFTYGVPHVIGHPPGGVSLHIGKFCSIADGVTILLGANHRTEYVSTYPFKAFPDQWSSINMTAAGSTSKGDVVIGNDVWIGYRAIILSGVTIGDGAVIGAGAVVAHDVPPYGIATGNPAETTKKRFDDETISELLALKWWDWPPEEIDARLQIIGGLPQAAMYASTRSAK